MTHFVMKRKEIIVKLLNDMVDFKTKSLLNGGTNGMRDLRGLLLE